MSLKLTPVQLTGCEWVLTHEEIQLKSNKATNGSSFCFPASQTDRSIDHCGSFSVVQLSSCVLKLYWELGPTPTVTADRKWRGCCWAPTSLQQGSTKQTRTRDCRQKAQKGHLALKTTGGCSVVDQLCNMLIISTVALITAVA